MSGETCFQFLERLKLPSGASLSSVLLQLLQALRNKDGRNSGAVAVQVAAFFRTLLSAVSASKSTTVDAIISHVQAIEGRLAAAAGAEFIAPNIARRVLCFIREEADKKASPGGAAAGPLRSPLASSSLAGADAFTVGSEANATGIAADGSSTAVELSRQPSAGTEGSGGVPAAGSSSSSAVAEARASAAAALAAMKTKASTEPLPSTSSSVGSSLYGPGLLFSAIRGGALDAVNELLDELDTASTTITANAPDLCNHDDVLLTCGYDAAVRDFILSAAKKKRVAEVFICEASDAATMLPVGNAAATGAAPVFPGHALAMELTSRAKPVPVTVIPDATVASVMHRVSKVLIGARGIAKDGSVAADSPAALLALTAKEGKKPVVVISNALRLIASDEIRNQEELEAVVDIAGQADPYTVLPRAAFDSAEAAFTAASASASASASSHTDAVAAVEIVTSTLDVLPASAVTLIVTNTGLLAPSAPSGKAQMERLHRELYQHQHQQQPQQQQQQQHHDG